ncbi:MAG: Co/Zn/Cd efflux system component [Alphaproteobacteria bacterium]|jgi:Co/Zn/Cd efflux system component
MPHDSCHDHENAFTGDHPAYRRALWAVIAINATMFIVEITAGFTSRSQALQADALDFLGDSMTYALSLFVIARPPVWRTNAALFKGVSLAVLGLWVLASTVWRVFLDQVPEPLTMGIVGLLALAANLISVLLLLRFRDGDANVQSVWLCSRNDAIGNIAVVIAASGVFATRAAWPDLLVAAIMASLFLTSSVRIIRRSVGERDALKVMQT